MSRRARIHLAASYGLGAVILLAMLFATRPFPPLWEWLLFGAAFGFMEWRSVQVNEGLGASATIMVVLTAAVVFGRDAAPLGVAALAVFGIFTPRDIRERRWFQPIANFGVFTLSAGLAAAMLQYALPAGPMTRADLLSVALGSAGAAVLYHLTNFSLVSLAVRSISGGRAPVGWSGMGELIPSYLLMGFLGGLLGSSYLLVGPVALPLIMAVFFVGHLSFASYAELREAHEATLRGFIKALEAKDFYTRGHTERVAYFAQITAEELGMRGARLERVRIAALIHDVGKLAVPGALIRKRGRLSEAEYRKMQEHAHMVEHVLAEVEFLRPMVEIASAHHSRFDGGGYGGSGHREGSAPCFESRILAVADAFDAMTSTRSYRMALTQEFAIAELRGGAGSQFDPDVVEGFVRALARTGERYGSSDLDDDEVARYRAEQGFAAVG